jgi:hypothetical protein
MTTTVIKAEQEGKCGICGLQYPIGTRIAQDRKTGRWAMADCIWPKAFKTNSSNKGPAATRTSLAVEAQALDADIGATVAKRLTAAKEIVYKSLPNLDLHEGYPVVLAEVLHQLGAEAMSIRIQACKERNLRVVRQ